MREVMIVGVGQTPVGELWKLSLRSLAVKAIQAARQEAGWVEPQGLYIGNMLASTISGQANLGALLVDEAHLNGIEGPTFEAAGASGAGCWVPQRPKTSEKRGFASGIYLTATARS